MKRFAIGCFILLAQGLLLGAQFGVPLAVLQATEENFDQVIRSKKPVIIDVNASWCGACQKIAPVFQELSEKYGDRILFVTIDVDSQNALADRYQVDALPTILFVKPGQKEPFMRSVGYLDRKQFEGKIQELLRD